MVAGDQHNGSMVGVWANSRQWPPEFLTVEWPGTYLRSLPLPFTARPPSHYHRQLSCALPSTSARPANIWRLSALSIVALTKGRSSYVPNYSIVKIRNSINFQVGRWKVLSWIWFTSTMRTPYVLDVRYTTRLASIPGLFVSINLLLFTVKINAITSHFNILSTSFSTPLPRTRGYVGTSRHCTDWQS